MRKLVELMKELMKLRRLWLLIAILLTCVVAWKAFVFISPERLFLGTNLRSQPVNSVGRLLVIIFTLWYVPILFWQYFKDKKKKAGGKLGHKDKNLR